MSNSLLDGQANQENITSMKWLTYYLKKMEDNEEDCQNKLYYEAD